MTRCHHHRSIQGYCSCLGPPRTFEEACQAFREKDIPFPRFERINQEERDAVNDELYYHWHSGEPWHGSNPEWRDLNVILRREIRKIRYPPPDSSSSEEESGFDDDRERLAPARGASHRAVASGRADRTGGHPNYMPSHYASDPEFSDWEAISPPPHSNYPGARNDHRRHRDVHETARRHGGRLTGAFHEYHGSYRHQGGRLMGASREDHGNSRHHGDLNAGYPRVNSWDRDIPREHDAGASPSASESQDSDDFESDWRYMNREGLSEERSGIMMNAHNIVRASRAHQRSNTRPSGRRRRR